MMTRTLVMTQDTPILASSGMIQAAVIVREAAEELGAAASHEEEADRFFLAADRIDTVLRSHQVGRKRLIMASPSLVERSGRTRSLVEMIEAEKGDDQARFRLAKLLFRALLWRPESFRRPTC